MDRSGVCIGSHALYPREMTLNHIQNPHQFFLRQNQGVSVHQKEPVLPPHKGRGKQNVGQNDVAALNRRLREGVIAAKREALRAVEDDRRLCAEAIAACRAVVE